VLYFPFSETTPTNAQIDTALEQMVAGIEAGHLGQALVFDRFGTPVQLA